MRFTVPMRQFSRMFWACVPQSDFTGTKYDSRSLLGQNCSYLDGLCRKLGAKTAIEIGAGLSTTILSEIMDRVWTCDRNKVEWGGELPNVIYKQSESTEFLAGLEEQADVFFIDARLKDEDFAHIKRLSKPCSVYLLDDFEGIEKGVTNVLGLYDGSRILMCPADGRWGRSTLAALVPQSAIRLTNQ